MERNVAERYRRPEFGVLQGIGPSCGGKESETCVTLRVQRCRRGARKHTRILCHARTQAATSRGLEHVREFARLVAARRIREPASRL